MINEGKTEVYGTSISDMINRTGNQASYRDIPSGDPVTVGRPWRTGVIGWVRGIRTILPPHYELVEGVVEAPRKVLNTCGRLLDFS